MSGLSQVVPRWEWRTFGATFGAADAVLAGLTPTAVEESGELYLLYHDGDNVKKSLRRSYWERNCDL